LRHTAILDGHTSVTLIQDMWAHTQVHNTNS
jgi:hypothetical protein